MIESMIDFLGKPTYGASLLRTVISASMLVTVVAGFWWLLYFSRPRGWVATVCQTLIWLVVVGVWAAFVLPMLNQ
jgi:hypothetical protein